MIERAVDMWELEADARCVTTNGRINKCSECVMGRGTALQAKQRYPWLPGHLGYLIRTFGNNCYPVPTPDGWLVSFPTKEAWGQRALLWLIERSCKQLLSLADWYNWQRIVLPRPGAGNGCLDYAQEVRPIIGPQLDDRFVVVTWDVRED